MFCSGRQGSFYFFPVTDVPGNFYDSGKLPLWISERCCCNNTWDRFAVIAGFSDFNLHPFSSVDYLSERAFLGVTGFAGEDIITLMSLYFFNTYPDEPALGPVYPDYIKVAVY